MTEPRPPIHPAPDDWPETRDYHREQTDEIERLRARVKELEGALRPFAAQPMSNEPRVSTLLWSSTACHLRAQAAEVERQDAEIANARAVLEKIEGE